MTVGANRPITSDLRERVLSGVTVDANATVAVAMSGGVDSSVVAALLKHLGFHVIGVTMNVWPESTQGAAEDAQEVADALGISHHVIDLREQFRKLVVDEFCREYARGRTPNPCVMCNPRIKFGLLFSHAMQLGADWLATGHYVRVTRDPDSGRYLLLKGIDPRRDQSYVLYRLTQDQLSRVLFPLGGYHKQEVRAMAEDFGLSVADRSESREICFVPDDDYRGFLRKHGAASADCSLGRAAKSQCNRKGAILNTSGGVLGTHDGIENFTVGQRKGLGIALGRRLYVVELDPETNSVIVGDESELYSSELVAGDCNWISIDRPSDYMRASAKIRYASPPIGVTVLRGSDSGDRIRVVFDEPVRAVTPGQAVVLYLGDTVVGGGTIERAVRKRRT